MLAGCMEWGLSPSPQALNHFVNRDMMPEVEQFMLGCVDNFSKIRLEAVSVGLKT